MARPPRAVTSVAVQTVSPVVVDTALGSSDPIATVSIGTDAVAVQTRDVGTDTPISAAPVCTDMGTDAPVFTAPVYVDMGSDAPVAVDHSVQTSRRTKRAGRKQQRRYSLMADDLRMFAEVVPTPLPLSTTALETDGDALESGSTCLSPEVGEEVAIVGDAVNRSPSKEVHQEGPVLSREELCDGVRASTPALPETQDKAPEGDGSVCGDNVVMEKEEEEEDDIEKELLALMAADEAAELAAAQAAPVEETAVLMPPPSIPTQQPPTPSPTTATPSICSPAKMPQVSGTPVVKTVPEKSISQSYGRMPVGQSRAGPRKAKAVFNLPGSYPTTPVLPPMPPAYRKPAPKKPVSPIPPPVTKAAAIPAPPPPAARGGNSLPPPPPPPPAVKPEVASASPKERRMAIPKPRRRIPGVPPLPVVTYVPPPSLVPEGPSKEYVTGAGYMEMPPSPKAAQSASTQAEDEASEEE